MGLHIVGMLVCSADSEANQNSGSSSVSQPPSQVGSDAATRGLPDQQKTYRWCPDAIQKQQTVDEWVVSLFSGLKATDIMLAVFTVMLVWVGHKQADISDRQADIAERAIIGVDRPFVFVEVGDPGFEIRWIESSQTQVFSGRRFELRVVNYGQTPGILTRFEYNITTAIRGEIGNPIDSKTISGRALPAGIVVTQDKPFSENTTMNSVLTSRQKDAVANFRESVWLIGFVRYDDLLGGNYISGFAQVYDPVGMRFVIRGDETYNYARKEKADEIPAPPSRE